MSVYYMGEVAIRQLADFSMPSGEVFTVSHVYQVVPSDHSHQPIWHRTHLVITTWYHLVPSGFHQVVPGGIKF